MNTEIITALDAEAETGLIRASESDTAGQEAIILFESSVTDDSPMTDAEWHRRDELESQITGNWVQIALYRREIKELKLYRRTRDGEKQTWEEYCKRVWGRSKQFVDRTIRAVAVIEILKMETTVSVFPATVSQAASLSGLKPNEMALVTEAAFKGAESEGRSVTETDFRKAVEKVKPPKNKGKKKPSTKPKATPQPKADEVAVEVQPNDVPTGSVSVHVNTVSLVRPVRRIFELFGLKPRDSQNLNGTVFTFDGTAIDEKNLFENLADLAVSEGPLDLRITLE